MQRARCQSRLSRAHSAGVQPFHLVETASCTAAGEPMDDPDGSQALAEHLREPQKTYGTVGLVASEVVALAGDLLAACRGQWSSPALGHVDGVQQAFFPGGDGWIYGFNARTGEKLWRFD